MDGFGDKFDPTEVDPAAEFLAREQNELAGLDDDLTAAPVEATPHVINDEGIFGIPQTNDAFGETQAQPLFSSFGTTETTQNPFGNPNDEKNILSKFEFDDIPDQVDEDQVQLGQEVDLTVNNLLGKVGSGDVTTESQFGIGEAVEDALSNPGPPSQSSSPAHRPTPVREEPEKIKKWREEQKRRLEEKDANEEKKKEEWREAAKKELEEWYRHHDDLISKTRAANRNAEKQFVADDDKIEPGTEWERIAKLCDFNPKASKGCKDVSRMRSIILQLKQNPLPVNGLGNKRS